jgi:hypothetical protein
MAKKISQKEKIKKLKKTIKNLRNKKKLWRKCPKAVL